MTQRNIPKDVFAISPIDSSNQKRERTHSDDSSSTAKSNLVLKLDRNGIVLFANQAGQNLLKSWGLTVDSNIQQCDLSNRALELFQDVSFEVLTRQVSKSLEIKIGKKDYLFFFAPIPSLGYVHIHGVDITKRKKQPKTSGWKEESYKALFNEIFDSVVIVDSSTGIILDCNKAAAELLGMSIVEIIGQNQRFLNNPEGFPLNQNGLLESKVTAKNGESKDVLVKLKPIKAHGENLIQVIFKDICSAKKLEKTLKEITLYKLSDISKSGCFIVESHEKCFKTYSELTKFGVPGLCIIREDPQKVISDYGINPEQIKLLSSKAVGNYEVLPSLQSVSLAVSNALKANPICVIVLDGLEYLISRSGFQPVYSFIQERRFDFIQSEALLLMPVNLSALDAKEKALLTSELKIIDSK